MKIFSGRSNIPLAEAICQNIEVPMGKASIRDFPNGETFVKIDENVRGEDVYVVQSTCPPVNQNMMELFIMIDALRRASASRITAVLPFYGYARQDRKDQPRVPISAKLVANLLVAAGVNRVLTVDLHAQQIQGFFDIPVDHLYAAPVMFEYLKTLDLGEQVAVVSPDTGGIKMAHAYSQLLHADLAIVAKRRMNDTETETEMDMETEHFVARTAPVQVMTGARARGKAAAASCTPPWDSPPKGADAAGVPRSCALSAARLVKVRDGALHELACGGVVSVGQVEPREDAIHRELQAALWQ